MKTQSNLFLSCILVILLTACSIIEKVGDQIQSDSSPSQEIPAGDLPPGGCPENLGKIVFQYDPMDKGGAVHHGIYIMNADGGGRVRLSSEDEIHHTQPAWSPDRCRIAFRSSTKDGDYDIFVMNADGSSIRRLTTDPARDMFPDWSPDGEQIVFVSYRNGGIRNLWIMNSDGSDQHQLTFNPAEYTQWEQWSPVGNEIAYIFHPETTDSKGGVIYLINSDGSNIRQLTPDAGSLGDVDLTWSPDGMKIYFISNRSHYIEIWEINVDGSGLRQITYLPDDVDISHSLRVSPDGTQLAVYGVGMDVGQHSQEIYVINVDGTGLTDITLSPGQEEWLDW